LSDVIFRSFKPTDKESFLGIQAAAFGGLEYLPRINAGLSAIDEEGSFIAEKNGSIVGCVGLFKFERPHWYEIRNLAVRDPSSPDLAKQLLSRVVRHAESQHAQYLKASTPSVKQYVDTYKSAGFEPVRRSLRIRWDLSQKVTRQSRTEIKELSSEHANDAAEVWVKGLRPYWDYWIEEEGGPDELKSWVRESVPKRKGWIGSFIDGRLVGLAIHRADFYGPGIGRFNGAYVLPEFRERGIGSDLMTAVIDYAQRLDQKEMKVYTLALLDHLAPGALLYLKSGGKIEAEYIQLQKKM
jgi:N-acetylglutamate synthase-like GNAT family acetyltransferase